MGQLVEGATATTGACRGTTTTISGSVILLTADPTIGLLAAMGAAEMAGTAGNARVLYVDPLGTRPSGVLRATSLKMCASFPIGKCDLKPVGCVS